MPETVIIQNTLPTLKRNPKMTVSLNLVIMQQCFYQPCKIITKYNVVLQDEVCQMQKTMVKFNQRAIVEIKT